MIQIRIRIRIRVRKDSNSNTDTDTDTNTNTNTNKDTSTFLRTVIRCRSTAFLQRGTAIRFRFNSLLHGHSVSTLVHTIHRIIVVPNITSYNDKNSRVISATTMMMTMTIMIPNNYFLSKIYRNIYF